MTRLLAYCLLAAGLCASVLMTGGVYPRQWEWCALAISAGSAVWAFARADERPAEGRPWVTIFLVALMGWMALQLAPLPAALLRLLSPMRWDAVAAAREATGQAKDGWAALSLAPGITMQRLLDVIPAMAAFIAAREMGRRWRDRRWVAVAPVIAVAWIESLLGLLQFLAHGRAGVVSGTYVNRNHFAGLLEMAFPLAVVAAVAAWRRRVSRQGHAPLASVLGTVGLSGIAGCLLLGIFLSLSRAGVVATLAGITVLLAQWIFSARQTAAGRVGGLRRGIVVLALLFTLALLPASLVSRFADHDASQEGRTGIWRNALALVSHYWLTGTGLGCFERGFYRYQDVDPDMTVDYAHNDGLQVMTELGIAGGLLAGALAMWILWQPLRIVMGRRRSHNRLVALGLFVALLSFAIHSLFDFNLYIPANALVFAWLGGLAASFASSERTPLRLLFPAAGILIAALSITLDLGHVDPNSWYCRAGLCRFDQIFAAPSGSGDLVADVATLVNEDPSNPMVWSTYAEVLSGQGRVPEAAAAFERAVSLGPNLSGVLMRAANFDLGFGQNDRGYRLANRLLRLTAAFDQPLFQTLTQTGAPTAGLLGSAIPPQTRAAKSWLAFLCANGSDEDLRETWAWMRQNRLDDQESAVEITSALWQRQSFAAAQDVWTDWRGAAQDSPERLSNTSFEKEPSGSPLDWTLGPVPSVEISRHDGLEVRFTGAANLGFKEIHQFATVSPGLYRLSAEIGSEGITTDEGPYFRVFDPVKPSRLDVRTPQVHGTVARTWLRLDFRVVRGTEAVKVQLERDPSERFDNRIAGTLHVYRVSLVPAGEEALDRKGGR